MKFQPGQSGNPGGQRRYKALATAYREKLEQKYPDDPQGRTYAQFIADYVIAMACSGVMDAVKEITDRTEGKAMQAIEHSGSIGHEYELTPFPDKAPTVDAWASRYADSKKTEGIN